MKAKKKVMVDMARRLFERDGWALVECCSRCGRDCPDGRDRDLCYECRRRHNRPKVVDAYGARLQRMIDAEATRRGCSVYDVIGELRRAVDMEPEASA